MTNHILLQDIRQAIKMLAEQGRHDVLLELIGVPTLQALNIEAAKARLSRLVITPEYRFLLPDYNNVEVEMGAVHKALYILFIRHTEGIELKRLQEHRDELLELYRRIGNRNDRKAKETIDRLVNPLDNSVNEKCARIKGAFAQYMDSYQLCHYAISSHTTRHVSGTNKVWFERKKNITLPRELVVFEGDTEKNNCISD